MSDSAVRSLGKLTICGFILILLFGGALTVLAQEPAPEPVPQLSIAFMDEKPLTVDLAWLRTKEGALLVEIRNTSEEEQFVDLSLEGFIPSEGGDVSVQEGLIEEDGVGRDVASGKVGDHALSFDTSGTYTDTIEYKGVLVAASSPGGDVIRKDFTLKIKADDKGDDKGDETTIDKTSGVVVSERIDALTLNGTSFLPSFISPLWPFLFWTGVLLIGLSLLLQKWPENNLGKLPKKLTKLDKSASLVIGLMLMVFGLVAMISVWTGSWRSIEWIPAVVDSATVPKGTESGPVSSAAGGLVSLEVIDDERLEVGAVPHAGIYTGKIDVLPDDNDKGAVTVTVNVTDWWPYAFIFITLGVIVGYYVVKSYNERPLGLVKLRAATLIKMITQSEDDFRAKYEPKPYVAYSIVELATKAGKDAEDKFIYFAVDEAKTDADELLDKLYIYFREFENFRNKLVGLDERIGELKSVLNPADFGLTWDQVQAYQTSDRILRGPGFPSSDLTKELDSSDLTSQTTATATSVTWLTKLHNAIGQVNRDLTDVKENPAVPKAPETIALLLQEGKNMLEGDETAIKKALDVANKGYEAWAEGKVKSAVAAADYTEDSGIEIGVDGESETAGAGSEDEIEHLAEGLRQSDLRLTYISGLLAIGSGFVALYLKADVVTWGAPGDYMAAFLWGAGVSEGTKLVVNLVKGVVGQK